MNQEYSKIIQDAQFRKGLSIGFFNSLNSAITLVSSHKIMPQYSDEELKTEIVKWRDWFINEHNEYYAQNIANIGNPFNTNDAISRLEAVTSKDEMRKVWLGFSEEVRRDTAVIEKLAEVKKRYETL